MTIRIYINIFLLEVDNMREKHPFRLNKYRRKRILAFALSFLMVLSLFGNISFKTFADGGNTGSASIEDFLNHVTVFTDYDYNTATGTAFDANKSYPEDEVFTFRLEFMESYDTDNQNQFDGYTTFTYVLPDGIDINSVQGDDIRFTDYDPVNPVGNFIVNTDGTITVTLLTDYIEKYKNAQCWLTFDATLALAGDETEKTITFPDGTDTGKTITIKVDSEPGISTTKSATYDAATKTATYTATATVKNGDMSNVTVKDVMGQDLTYASDVTYVITDSNGAQTGTGTIPANGTTGGFTSDTIGTVAEGSTITFTYTAKVDENAYKNNQVDLTDNNITVTGDYVFDNETKKATSTSYYDIDNIVDFDYSWISKAGSLDEANKEVDWTVTINESREYALNGVTFTDVLGDFLDLPADFVINVAKTDGAGVTTNETITSANYTVTNDGFTYLFNDTQPYTYVFTYSTPYDVSSEFGGVNLANKSTIASDDIGTHEDDAVVPINATTGIQKQVISVKSPNADGSDMGYVVWKTVITVPAEGLKDVSIVDTLPGVYDHNVGHSNYCTLDSASVTSSNGVVTSYNSITDTTDNNGIVNGFTVELGDLPPNATPYTVEITYKTNTAVGFDYVNNKWVNNSVKLYVEDIEKSNTSATAELVPPVDMVKSGSVDGNGVITYTLQLDPGQVGFDGTAVSVDDIFDTSKFEYVSGSATLYGSESKWHNYQNINPGITSVNSTSTGVKFDLGVLDNNNFTDANTGTVKPYVYFLTYQLKIKDETLASTQGDIVIDNTAKLYKDVELAVTSENTETYNNMIMDKNLDSYPSSSDSRFMFSVVLNKGKLDLVDGSNDITIVDVMSDNLTLDISSVTVYEYKLVTEGWTREEYVALDASEYTLSYDNNTKTISVKVPSGDGKHLKLSYGARISGLIGSVQTVTNDVYLEGTAIADNIGSIDYTVTAESSGNLNQSAGATGSVSYLEINKYDSLIASKVLANAKFDLYAVNMVYDADADKYTFTLVNSVLGTYTSNEDGVARVEYADFLNNGVYLLRETKAPFGYELGDTTIVNSTAKAEYNGIYESDFVFIFQSSTEQTTQEKLEILNGSGLPVVNSGGTILIPNEKKPLSVTATKNLVGRDMVAGEFKFKLTECYADGTPVPGGKVAYGTNGEATAVNGVATSTITFEDVTYDDLEFPTSDTVHQFYYILSEETLSDADIIYDDTVSQVIDVKVSIDARGDMQIAVNNANLAGDYESGVEFTNIHTGSLYATYDITATKTVNSQTPTASQIFEFDIVEVDAAGNVKAGGYSETVVNDGSDIDFATLSFTEVGDYYYKITERNAGVNGYTYDESSYIVHINTAVDAQGVLVATADIKKDGVTAQAVSFNNGYRELTSITVDKVWLDGNNADGTRPDSIEVELLANGSQIDTNGTYVATLNAANNYSYTWTDVPVETENGITIPYSVVERNVPTGYRVSYSGNTEDGFVVTNTQTTSISGTKTWVDNNNDHSSDTITVNLYADGTEYASKEVSAATGWSYEFDNLPMYKADGSEIVYTVDEELTNNNYVVSINGYDITNTLASTTVSISAEKELIGDTSLVGNKFSFTVTLVDANGNAVVGSNAYSDTVGNGAGTLLTGYTDRYSANVSFKPITYYNAGTYTYQIKEVAGSEAYVYDTTVYTAEVVVTRDVTDNSLSAKVKYYKDGAEVTKPVFTNTKIGDTPNVVDIIFSGNKKVTGAAVTNGFTFELYENDLTSTLVQSMNNDGGSFTFNKISKNAVLGDVYTYYVVEKPDSAAKPGYAFDERVYKIVVTFVDDGNGGLTPNYAYTRYASKADAQANTNGTSATAIEFTNTYTATGTLDIPVIKKYYANNDSQNFGFTLESSDGHNSNATINITANSADSATGNSDKFTLNYTEADSGKTYIYKITETAGTDTDITYDDTEYNLVVKVIDDGEGTLSFDTKVYNGLPTDPDTVVVDLADGIVFENTKTEDGQITFSATKKLVTATGGTKTLEADQFEFTLTQTDAGSNYSETVENDAAGNVTFTPIAYTIDDIGKTYNYEIKETSTDGNGYTVDNTVYTVKVKVESAVNPNGGYVAAPVATYYKTVNGITTELSEASEVVFTNTYTATGSITLEATKELTGGTLTGNDFEFVLTENGTTIDTAKNDANGKVTFDTITYNYEDIGTHTYVISEKKGSNGQVKYSDEKYTVKVVVSDNDNGTLNVAATYYSGTDTTGAPITADEVKFTNIVIADTTVPLSGKKELQGTILAPNQFEFQLKDANGRVIETVKNDSTGEFNFTPLEFTASAAGNSYEFTVTEVNKGDTGYTYDSNVYKVTIAVTENAGTLAATPTFVKLSSGGAVLDAQATAIEFYNKYEASNSLSLSATKTVVGGDGAVPNGEFSFTLSDETGLLQTVTNTGADVEFAPIEYDMDDAGKTYTYVIKEEDTGNPDIIYDDSYYTVVAMVSDHGTGELIVDKVIYNGDVSQGNVVSDIEFVNIAIEEGSFVPVAEKVLTGRKLAKDDFTFKLTGVTPNNSISAVVPYTDTATNDGSGNVIFNEINYTMADVGNTYVYEISEVAGGSAAYTYDDTIYTVEVQVIYDNATNKIIAIPAITQDGNTVTNIRFINEYNSSGSVVIKGEKYLNDKLTDEKFTFGIYTDAACTSEIGTTTNDKEGKFSFEFSYNEGNLDGTSNKVYTYYVKEIAPSVIPMGYTYDDTVYPVNVVLIDLGNGTISATASYPNNNDTLEIYNTYKDKNVTISKVDMSNSKELPGAELTITDKDGKEISKWTSTDKPHIIPATIFNTGEEYTLTEVTAPKGYAVAESIVFKIDVAGDVYVKNASGVFEKLEDGMIVMEDRPQAIDTSTDTNINTGDKVPVDMLVTLLFISAFGIVAMLISKRKKED